MSASTRREDRTRLDSFELEIFKLVLEHATSAPWREWLRAPLEHAAAKGNEDIFTRLMDAGADGSAGWRGCHRRTLLGAAAYGKSKKIVVALLEAGARHDVNVTFGAKCESALHVAAKQGAEAASRLLMTAGADPNLRSAVFARSTPLHVAAQAGHDVVVGMLLLKGALPNEKTEYRKDTALHLAARWGHELCVSELLLAGADKNSRNRNGSTPLHLAAQNNRLGALEKLVAAEADVDVRDVLGRSSLHDAASQSDVDVVRALLRNGSGVEESDDRGLTPLHGAAATDRGKGDVVRVLLEAGADIDAKSADYGSTPLHVDACRRCILLGGTIHALLEGGANINAREFNGDSPLHTACVNSCVEAVEILLRWGADETLVNQSGGAAVDKVGTWERDEEYYFEEYGDEEEERRADDQRIRHMLSRAPADRSWRRRGWVVLARSRPDRVQLVDDNRRGHDDSSTKVARARCDGAGGDGSGTGDPGMVGLQRLVGKVVGLDVEDVFRLVIGFL